MSLDSRPPLAESSSSASSIVGRGSLDSARVTLTRAGSSGSRTLPHDSPDLVLLRIQEALSDAKERGAQSLKLDRPFVEAIVKAMETKKVEYANLKGSFDGIKVRKLLMVYHITSEKP